MARAKDSLKGDKDKIKLIQADVTDEEDVKSYVKQTVDTYGHIDVFFNNAGINGPFAKIKDLEKEQFEKVMGINVTGIFLGLKHVILQMESQGYGSIINILPRMQHI
ncbi:short chain dehydrogenase [Lentibacillus halodurans]|uniref:Short chain dehydrogenase n=1 Tax=Lentibacillus halodurans TaxID=237679 RepID=A0A1I0ZBR6_9BACI|nr:SDR family NAD(P)-dependent oxidoreductase [Lentibacillus halodurans]SFB22807.1 short chain dehydrogenase [Lentibacillus halodurans]